MDAGTVQHMRINHCGSDVFVSKQFLNATDVVPVLQQMRGEAVSEGMAARRFSDSGRSDGQFDGVLKVLFRDVMPPQIARARIEGRLCRGKEILPHEVAGGIGIFSFQSKGQINFPAAPGEILSMQFLDVGDLAAQRLL